MTIQDDIKKRRMFAIISHLDTGKTMITGQLLYFGRGICEAGTVKGKRTGNFAESDWMDVEKQRGISVTSSVMQFDYAGKRVNILDTPGHEGFSEDTYRTLMAVNATVMVVNSAKGIEAQTKRLFEVVKHRNIPVFTFINKPDRDGHEPPDLLEELEEVLGTANYSMNWPIGMGKSFEGLYNLYNKRLELYKGDERFAALEAGDELFADGPFHQRVLEDVELLEEAGNEFSEGAILSDDLTLVFFGSALTSFGVRALLDTFLQFAPESHGHRTTEDNEIDPYDKDFSGFVFKAQANMDPRHRDHTAFVRIVSGEFERGMSASLARTKRPVKLPNATQFMAESRKDVESVAADDIIGVYDTGTYQVGNTLTVGKNKFELEPLPTFTSELLMKVTAKNVMKQKSFHKGIEQLVQEGVIQLYKNYQTGEYILGAVGQLQSEVFKHRMENEYNAEVVMTPMGKKTVRRIKPEDLDEHMSSSRNILARDRFGQPVFLFENDPALRWFADKCPDVELEEKM